VFSLVLSPSPHIADLYFVSDKQYQISCIIQVYAEDGYYPVFLRALVGSPLISNQQYAINWPKYAAKASRRLTLALQ
jgi:hypothetical protein